MYKGCCAKQYLEQLQVGLLKPVFREAFRHKRVLSTSSERREESVTLRS